MRNHTPCITRVIQLALGAFVSDFGVKDPTKFSEAHEHDQQFGENGITGIGTSQRLRKENIAKVNKGFAMK